jgi:hypothetical protein
MLHFPINNRSNPTNKCLQSHEPCIKVSKHGMLALAMGVPAPLPFHKRISYITLSDNSEEIPTTNSGSSFVGA